MRRMVLTLALTCAVLAGCGSGSSATKGSPPPYTVKSIKAGFITRADLGNGAIELADSGHLGAHVIYTPTDSVPTCPYVQRADTMTKLVQPALELAGGNPTGRFVVGPGLNGRASLPVVTQGALVFKSEVLATDGMDKVEAEAAKCPATFTISGGPPEIVGNYAINTRPCQIGDWRGFAQQLEHTFPSDVNTGSYDDLVTVVVHKANAVLYVGYEQTKKTGQRADSAAKVSDALKATLGRLG